MSAASDEGSFAKRQQTHLQRCIRWARARCGVSLLLQYAAVALVAAGVAVAIAITVERTLTWDLVNLWTAAGLAGLAILAVGAMWLLTMPGRMAVAVMVDERLGLRERLSTALALADNPDPFARAARNEAQARARGVHVRREFPIQFTRRWAYAAGAWILAAALMALLPGDLLGIQAKRNAEQKKNDALAEARTETQAQVRQIAKVLRSSVGPLADDELAANLTELDKLAAEAPESDDVKREAIRKLGDLSDQLTDKLNSDKFAAAAAMKQMLKGIRGTSDAESRQLSAALAKGDYKQAAKLLEQIQQDLADGKLSPQKCKSLADAMGKLGDQVGEAGHVAKQKENALESKGLDKRLAGMSPDQMRQALKEQGMSDQQIDDIMREMSAIEQACQGCQGLSDALAEVGENMGLTPEDMAELVDQLRDMAGLDGEMGQCEASLEEIEAAIAKLGESEGECAGAGAWREGLALRPGRGTGGPGRGYGQRDEDSTGGTSVKKTRTDTKTGKGPVIASWHFKGSQVKGEAKKDFAKVVQAGRDHAAEAINENKIPRRCSPVVKKYYDEFNKAGGGEPSE